MMRHWWWRNNGLNFYLFYSFLLQLLFVSWFCQFVLRPPDTIVGFSFFSYIVLRFVFSNSITRSTNNVYTWLYDPCGQEGHVPPTCAGGREGLRQPPWVSEHVQNILLNDGNVNILFTHPGNSLQSKSYSGHNTNLCKFIRTTIIQSMLSDYNSIQPQMNKRKSKKTLNN